MLTVEQMTKFARTLALKDRQVGRFLNDEEFSRVLNAYARTAAIAAGVCANTAVLPLFSHKALSVYRAITTRSMRVAA